MALDKASNFAKSSVSTGYDASATSIVLESTDINLANWPDPATYGAYNAVWWDATNYADPADDPNREIVRVTAKNVATLTVTRAQESTTATVKNTAGSTYKMAITPTAKLVDDLNSAFIDAGTAYGWVTDAPYSATGDGVTDDYAAFAAAVAALTHIVIPSGTYVLGTDLTVGTGITLEIQMGATLSPSSGKTLTINGPIIAGDYDWQGGSGTITLGTRTGWQSDRWDGTSASTLIAPSDVSIPANDLILRTKKQTNGTTAPASGTWAVGDICWNTAPAETEYGGWICTVAGTPGTWIGFAPTMRVVESAAIDVSSTGDKALTIAHGLGYTPAASQIALTVYRSSGTGDPVIRPLFIEAIDGTNVTIFFYVYASAATTELKVVMRIFPA